VQKKSLIGLISAAKILQEFVSQAHQLVHPHVFLPVVRNLEQVQHHRVNAHVSQEPLLVFARP
jgi:hypothetical protein